MTMLDGDYRIGSDFGQLLVRTGRTGLGSRAGHDLIIEATQWDGTVTVNAAEPGRSSVAIEVGVDSLEVRSGSGGVKPLTAGDRAEIRRIIREKMLHTARHPTVTFRSTGVSGSPEALAVDGELTVMGESRPVTVRARLGADGRVQGGATVVQSRWGITPYSAFFGALKVADEVAVEFDATLHPAG
jgi:polyisoprenoid-binding protein YceI